MSELAPVRHVCGISGGKDSAALAIYLKEVRKLPNVEYFFSDTGKELPEVYEFPGSNGGLSRTGSSSHRREQNF